MTKNYFSIIIILLCTTNSFTQEIQLKKLYAYKNKSDITYAMNHPLHSWKGISNDMLSVILLDTSNMEINEITAQAQCFSMFRLFNILHRCCEAASKIHPGKNIMIPRRIPCDSWKYPCFLCQVFFI